MSRVYLAARNLSSKRSHHSHHDEDNSDEDDDSDEVTTTRHKSPNKRRRANDSAEKARFSRQASSQAKYSGLRLLIIRNYIRSSIHRHAVAVVALSNALGVNE